MKIVKMKVSELNPAYYNPRKDLQPGDAEYQKIKRSIDEFGLVEPLVWNKKTERLVGGHQRLKILKEAGQDTVEVSVVDLEEDREKLLNVALNKSQGDWDNERLLPLLQEMEQAGTLDISGFDSSELAAMLEDGNLGDEFQRPGFNNLIDEFEKHGGAGDKNEFYFYVEFYQEPELFQRLKELLPMRTEHEIDPDFFRSMVEKAARKG